MGLDPMPPLVPFPLDRKTTNSPLPYDPSNGFVLGGCPIGANRKIQVFFDIPNRPSAKAAR